MRTITWNLLFTLTLEEDPTGTQPSGRTISIAAGRHSFNSTAKYLNQPGFGGEPFAIYCPGSRLFVTTILSTLN